MIRLINNKRIDLTDKEFEIYEGICKEYSRDNFNGKDLFIDLFETDQDGIIVFLIPPKLQFSMEVIVFLQNVMIHQHLRKIYEEHDEALEEMRNILSEVKKTSS